MKDRVFQSEWQSKYTWLANDADKKIMTCEICLEANKSNTFTILPKGHHCKTSNFTERALMKWTDREIVKNFFQPWS